MTDCFICRRHRALDRLPGGEIAGDEHALVTHLPLVMAALTADEAASVGRLATAASRALERSEGAEHVYAAVIGHGVDHFHLHLIPRYPGTPREYWWVRVDEWPDAPRGDSEAIGALSARLRGWLGADR